MKRWKGNVTNSAYDAEGKFYLADEAQAEIDEYSKVAAETAEKNGRLQAEIDEYRIALKSRNEPHNNYIVKLDMTITELLDKYKGE